MFIHTNKKTELHKKMYRREILFSVTEADRQQEK